MGSEHVVILERPAKLSINTGRLSIVCGEHPANLVACGDVAALMIAHPAVQMSAAVVSELASAGAVTLFMNRSFLPVALAVPQNGNAFGARRPHQQAELLGSAKARCLWNQIIRAKIRGQAENFPPESEVRRRMLLLADRCRADEPENPEGMAAKIYWEAFFPELTGRPGERVKRGAADRVNSALNYAYAILRAATARSLSCGGFCLNFGLGHCRKDNPCNLAEDFMEVFRFVAEQAVMRIVCEDSGEEVLSSGQKKKLIGAVLETEIVLERKEYRLFPGIDAVVQSYGAVLDGKRANLILPHMPPLAGRKRRGGENLKNGD